MYCDFGFLPILRQEFCDAIDGMICNAGQDVTQVGFQVEAIELGGLDE
jgi:hypothetical protein